MSGFAISDTNNNSVAVDGNSEFDGLACLDLSSCYSVNLVPSSLGSGAGTLYVGGQTFAYADGTNEGFSSDFMFAIGSGCPVAGCMDVDACNYNIEAEEDDGSCIMPNVCGSCDGDESCLGCTDADACNYDSNATEDNGSCEYVSCTCPDGTVVTVTSGEWPSEISWQITDADGNVVAGGLTDGDGDFEVDGNAPYNECEVYFRSNCLLHYRNGR